MTKTLTEGQTVGRDRKRVDELWNQFRAAIDAAYKAIPAGPLNEDRDKHHPRYVRQHPNGVRTDLRETLRDYVENMAMVDRLDRLVETETKNEREHRRTWSTRGYSYPISAEQGAKVVLLHQAGIGAALPELPPATDFMIYRPAAVEAQCLGWLIAEHVTPEWLAACDALDYAAAVR